MSKIINISTSDAGGAGTAAYRIHSEFINNNMDSLLLVKNGTIIDKNIIPYRRETQFNSIVNKISAKFGVIDRIISLFLNQKYLFFSLFNHADLKKSNWLKMHLTDDTEVIIVHWTAGFMSLADVATAIKNKPIKVFINLVDMAHFTGGCHFSFGCKGYEKQCFNCPATISTQLSKKIRSNMMTNAIQFKEMGAIAISFSHFTLNQARNSSVPFNDYYFMKQPINENNFFSKEVCINKSENLKVTKKILMGSYNKHDERKGYFTFLLAVQKLSDLMFNKSLQIEILVPDDDDFSELQFENIVVVKYKKAVNETELRNLYLGSDLFISTSIDDTGPLMLAESLFCGIPVIATSTGCASELLNYDQKLGDLIEIMDHENLARIIFHRLFVTDFWPHNCKEIEATSKAFYFNAKKYIDLVE